MDSGAWVLTFSDRKRMRMGRVVANEVGMR
jgi:hypothetical protein